uniref:Peptidase M14 domain-containing protein n=1 Tax=Nelumbo nucifera TaxID=4432 RepID=A0A822Z5X7_NELNU|nr:TPA_asm: hypothetical protein HUJ06_016117 [Nelumbo nucifera]
MGSLLSNCSSWFLFFVFLQLLTLVNGRNLSKASFTPIKRDLYHSSDALKEGIKALVHRHPDRLTMETIRTGNEGYNAEILVVTYAHGRRKIDDSSNIRILLSFGQHGRELITSEVALRLLSILGEEYPIPKMGPTSLNSTLERLVIKVVVYSKI